mmetsp:Transcript_70876/g.148263  ORF Transcript_70876/g.148263 Transcript_70876/m.148263 type:complete len:222 (+) Transcript_70876:242-907(+)
MSQFDAVQRTQQWRKRIDREEGAICRQMLGGLDQVGMRPTSRGSCMEVLAENLISPAGGLSARPSSAQWATPGRAPPSELALQHGQCRPGTSSGLAPLPPTTGGDQVCDIYTLARPRSRGGTGSRLPTPGAARLGGQTPRLQTPRIGTTASLMVQPGSLPASRCSSRGVSYVGSVTSSQASALRFELEEERRKRLSAESQLRTLQEQLDRPRKGGHSPMIA